MSDRPMNQNFCKAGPNYCKAGRWASLLLLASSLGCQMSPLSGGLLSSMGASRHDRAITEHAANSRFRSPSDVGLTTEDEK